MKFLKNLSKDCYKLYCIILLLSISVILIWATTKNIPAPTGESDDYMMPTISLMRHGSLYITDDDITQAKEDFPNFSSYLSQQYDNKGFFHTETVKAHSWYMGTYSVACIPIKYILKLLNLNQEYTFIITNIVFYILSLFVVFFSLKKSYKLKFYILLVLICNPIIFYVNWISAEVFIFSLITISLVFWLNKSYYLSALFVSLAGSLNPTIMVYGAIVLFDFFIKLYQESKHEEKSFYKHCKYNFSNILKLGVCFIPSVFTFIYNYINFGSFNLQLMVGGTTDTAHILERFKAYLFDLNFGLLPYIPVLLLIFILFSILAIIKGKLLFLFYTLSFWGTVLAYSIMAHINCGMTQIARYNAWVTPILIFLLLIFIEQNVVEKKLQKVIFSALFCSALITCFSVVSQYSYKIPRLNDAIMLSLPSKVLDFVPQLYNPIYSTFIARTTGVLGGYEYSIPVFYTTENGYIRKILVTDDTSDLVYKYMGIKKGTITELDTKIENIKNKEGYHYLNFNFKAKYMVKEEFYFEELSYIDKKLLIQRGAQLPLSSISYNDDCFINNSELILNPGGLQYGPYKGAKKGKYKVKIEGQNLDDLAIACGYNLSSITIPFTIIAQTSDKIVYTFELDNDVADLELKCTNQGNQVIKINKVSID